MKTGNEGKSNEQVAYYDAFVKRQVKVGVNQRHHNIVNELIRMGLKKNMHVLEIGCGIGTVSQLLLKKISKGRLLSLDLSTESIETAKLRLSGYKNAEFLVADITVEEIHEKFDFIVLPDVLEHIPIEQHHALFLKMKHLLKPDGKIVIHIPNPYHLDWCRAQGMEMQIIDQALYLPFMIENLKETGLYISFLEIYSIWIKEGDYQFIVIEKEVKFNKFNKITFKRSLFQKIKNRLFR